MTIAHLGPFSGSTRPTEELDGLLAYALTKSDLETARSLFSSCWWDYRFVHPGYRFFLFADLYAEEVENWRSRFGCNPYAQLKLTSGPIFRNKRKGNVTTIGGASTTLAPQSFRTSVWRAMCIADAHGIPYDRFIALGMAVAFDHQHTRLPLPSSLYTDGMVRDVRALWDEEKENLLRLPRDPRFMATAYEGHLWQNEFQKWLLDLIAARPNPALPLAQYLARERYLVPALAVQRFGITMVRDAIDRARSY